MSQCVVDSFSEITQHQQRHMQTMIDDDTDDDATVASYDGDDTATASTATFVEYLNELPSFLAHLNTPAMRQRAHTVDRCAEIENTFVDEAVIANTEAEARPTLENIAVAFSAAERQSKAAVVHEAAKASLFAAMLGGIEPVLFNMVGQTVSDDTDTTTL